MFIHSLRSEDGHERSSHEWKAAEHAQQLFSSSLRTLHGQSLHRISCSAS
jgi:hypothetical protein